MHTKELSKRSVIVTCHSDPCHYYSAYVGKVSPNKPVGFPMEVLSKAYWKKNIAMQ